ncbi:MAG: hypothetical protein DIU79_13060 [Actinobacteria bacterium]|nr:MAG: hypothetical protein DIU79_13060 [Actinomycetota bacterium]
MIGRLVPATPTTGEEAVRLLDDVLARVGVDGLATAYTHPLLLSLVREHAAAVRAAIADSEQPLTLVSLARYARSVIAATIRAGRTLPAPGEADLSAIDWLRAPWELLRLLGICALIDEADATEPAPTPPRPRPAPVTS